MKKRLLSILLAAIMVVSLLPVTAAAETANGINNWLEEKDKDENGGYITVDKEEAVEDETVTITVCPNEGFMLRDIWVFSSIDEENTIPYEIVFSENNTCFFTMPDREVSIWAEFLEKNQYWLEYDQGSDEQDGYVIVNGENAFDPGFDIFSFVKNEPISFELVQPEDRAGETPIVEIEVIRGDVYRSDFEEEDHKIALTDTEKGKAFTFTPDTDNTFIVRVWWSEFDAFWCEEEEYLVEVNGKEFQGSISFDKKEKIQKVLGNEAKYVFNRSDLPIELTITPDKSYGADFIVLGFWPYVTEVINEEFERPISELYDETTETYKYTITEEEEENYLYVEVHSDLRSPFFENTDPLNKVVDEATFDHYEKNVTTWTDFTFAGWFYMDGETEKEFTDGYGDACEQFPGVTFTAKWMDESGAKVPSETVEERIKQIEKQIEGLLDNSAVNDFNISEKTGIDAATDVQELIEYLKSVFRTITVDDEPILDDETLDQYVTEENITKYVELELVSVNIDAKGKVNSFAFYVAPWDKASFTHGEDEYESLFLLIPNDYIKGEITFRLPVKDTVTEKEAEVYHGDELLGVYPILSDENKNKYIEVKSDSFSEFSYVIIPETDPDPIVTFTHGDPIVLGEKAAKAGEANPNTGAPVLSMSLGMVVLTGTVLLLSKKKH